MAMPLDTSIHAPETFLLITLSITDTSKNAEQDAAAEQVRLARCSIQNNWIYTIAMFGTPMGPADCHGRLLNSTLLLLGAGRLAPLCGLAPGPAG